MKKIICAVLMLWGQGIYAQQPVKIACVGNSITEGPGRNHPDSYPLQLQKMLGQGYQVKNFGVSARTLLKKGDFPYWNEPQFEQVKDFKPDILVIKLGTNDSKPQNWVHKDEFLDDYVEMIRIFKGHMPDEGKVFVCLPAPVFEDNWGITEQLIVEEMNPLIREVARITGAEIIDLHGSLEPYAPLFPDGVHPDKEGAKMLARTVVNSIQ
ncbi:GDSL-type esterase/lipase family protein [Cyclobacterium jeungdonense]|uniref:GDSL-type esterase/lipase family protein n=1 Tax=Cyclobacterium jeungdonense TaxID=708087 RepID=A0ABT8C561_9BACT|nr:GDSL-type esterase/lipase family protein [Cyclobacterium jeungdonense]MDN3687894.1 GDSL-type esterase/lipase family protein [Cyclobacterium jeungdonense]